jgi:transposase-like protein
MQEAYGYEKYIFKQVCEICGSEFKVTCPGQKGHEEREEYYCPVCRQEFTCRASKPPKVTLLKEGDKKWQK